MKPMTFSMILCAGFMLTSSCSKTGDLFPGTEDKDLKSSMSGSQTIMVEPEGPMYDTQNLINAFAMAEANGSGSVISLAEGIFYLDKLDIYDFHGTLCGAGKGKTIIRTIPGGIHLPVQAPFIETLPFFIDFHGGDFTVCDMSFDINDDNPCQPYDWWTGGDVTFLGAAIRVSGISVEDYSANAVLKNLSFTGKLVNLTDFTPFNIDNCIIFGGGYHTCALGGNFTVQNCDFSTAETGVNALGLSHAVLTVGGSALKGNVMQQLNTGIALISGDKVNATIGNNIMTDIRAISGIEIAQNNIPSDFNVNVVASACNLLIYENSIELTGDYPDGIFFYDIVGLNDASEQTKAVIRDNLITMTQQYQSGVRSYSTFNTNILNNVITGQSDYGVLVHGYSSGCKIIFNNFDDYETTFTDILLYYYTEDNMVVCETESTSVYDATGLNIIKGPAEKGSMANMENYRSLKRNFQ